MNTPAHVIFAAAAFARPCDRPRTIAAVAGGLAGLELSPPFIWAYVFAT